MLYSEKEVRENLRNREGKRVFYLGTRDQLTSSARDYLTRERIEILPASQAAPERYRLLSGGFMEGKPEHMTHLNAQVLVPKTHPRIAFRGKLDSLEAELLLCGKDCPHLEKDLGEVLELARRIIRCDVLEEPLPDGKLCGLTEEELRKRSHFPQDFYGQPHFMPGIKDSREVLRLNRLRCAVREAEISAAAAFVTPEGSVTRPDILRAMNRMSSMVYILMIREKAAAER
ncbi:MAG: ATP-binding protein [Candidatus Faecousia sp.]|nr:ATP-binding protein [Clostridiales bacterium]MDY6181173.1 ATP-binding protein [Candidatus Faecousia sp.]